MQKRLTGRNNGVSHAGCRPKCQQAALEQPFLGTRELKGRLTETKCIYIEKTVKGTPTLRICLFGVAFGG